MLLCCGDPRIYNSCKNNISSILLQQDERRDLRLLAVFSSFIITKRRRMTYSNNKLLHTAE